jgi:hypothetical protein
MKLLEILLGEETSKICKYSFEKKILILDNKKNHP